MPTKTGQDTHVATTKMDIHEVARELTLYLGPTLVAVLANVRDRKLPNKWSKPGGVEPRLDAERRLRAAHRVWRTLAEDQEETTIRHWFIGMNPLLNDVEPFMVIRDGHFADVLNAARAFDKDSPNL